MVTTTIAPATAPLQAIPPPPMPRSFRMYSTAAAAAAATNQTAAYYGDREDSAVDEQDSNNVNVDEHISTFSENLNPNVPEFIPVINGFEENKKSPMENDGDIDECVEAIEDKLKFDDAGKKPGAELDEKNGEFADLGDYFDELMVGEELSIG